MEKFTAKIVSMMKAENLFEWQGGPIILSQVSTEKYHLITHIPSQRDKTSRRMYFVYISGLIHVGMV